MIKSPIIPTYVIVHIGEVDDNGKNIRVPFIEYIKKYIYNKYGLTIINSYLLYRRKEMEKENNGYNEEFDYQGVPAGGTYETTYVNTDQSGAASYINAIVQKGVLAFQIIAVILGIICCLKGILNIMQNRKLKKEVDIEVRGEIFMNKKTLIELNEKRKKNNQPLLQNCRNAAAGSIRQLDSKVAAERKLDNFIYHLPNPEDYGIKSQSEAIVFMEKLGFRVNTNNKLVNNIQEVIMFKIVIFLKHQCFIKYYRI